MENDKVDSVKVVRVIVTVVVIMLILVAIVATFLFFTGEKKRDSDVIALYGFSVKGEVMEGSIIPGFKDYWKERTGRDVSFETYFAGSGKITNQVVVGAPAEVMILSTEWDALKLEEHGCTKGGYRDLPHNGTVSMSPWVILTRRGNPKDITSFSDLSMPGVEIVHADPLTSGGACWSIFAVYGSQLVLSEIEEGSPNTTLAEEVLEGFIGNVISWQSSARKALAQFSLGYGDVLVTYENEALLALKMGEEFEMVYPGPTIYSEHKAVVVDRNVNDDEKELVDEFVDYLFKEESQKAMAGHGFRSIDEEINRNNAMFPRIDHGFTVELLGGWDQAHPDLIDGLYSDLRG